MKIQDDQGEKIVVCTKCGSDQVSEDVWMLPKSSGSWNIDKMVAKHKLIQTRMVNCKKCGNTMSG